MVESGKASFGDGQYGVVTKQDLAQILWFGLRYAKSTTVDQAAQYRAKLRKLLPLLEPEDRLMLAAEMPQTGHWLRLIEELKEI